MLSSDQVLHVARLARLELTPEEVERFGGELSKVLDHIELIAELGDLADVQPTSHVIDVENALRADEPRPSMPVEKALESAPDAANGGFRVPSPGSVMIELTAAQAAARIKTGELDAAEYFEFYRRRAAADAFNSYTWVAEDTPELDTDTPLAGVPVAVKDLFCTEGIPSQAGSKILEGYRPPYTATSVANLKAAGGTLLGKTNQDEFAMGSSTENSAYGPTLNPWDTTRVPGGSSGGSAASVAAGTAPWSIGTDTGGSIRQPAALTGIVGMKPTYGAISRYGMIAFASSLDQAGTFTRDVTDTALLLSAMVGADPCDSTSIGLPEPIALPSKTDLKGIRLGVPEELTGEGIEPGVLKAFNETLDLARQLGATVETMHLPHAPHGLAAYYLLAPAECSSNLARYDGVRYGFRKADAPGGLLGMYTATREQGFGPEVKRRIMLGTYALSSGYYDAYYGKAQKVRTLIARDFTNAWEQFDFIVTPTAPGVAFELGSKTADPLAMYLNDFCTVPMSLAGIPGISIPNGLSDGLPVGFQIAGPAFSENRILEAAYALEQAIGFDGSGGIRMSTTYEPVIGLEIHVQLKTRTKMFCGCELSFGEEPNTRTCPVCLGLPGTLPVTNAQAVQFGIMMGFALGCEIAPRSIFHRKNYFYPDLAKGYQISQYDIPLCLGGHLGDVRIHRIHLEEDAAKLVHVGESGRIHGSDASIVDYNRGGTPLAEIVTEPDIHSAEQARDWLQLLRETLRQLGVSDVNMEEGSLRCDANVSIRPVGSTELGTKTELKNMNSFRFVMQGINAEIARQTALVEAGDKVVQETLHFDPVSGRISSLRSKEEAHDYRYFPEPDLVPLVPTPEMLESARASIPELPAERSARYEQRFGLAEDTAHLFAFEPEWGDYFEQAAAGADPKATAIWVTELRSRDGASVEPGDLARLVALVSAKTVTAAAGRTILDKMVAGGGDPAEIAEREGLTAMDDSGELEAIVAKVIAEHPDVVERIKGGNAKAMGALVGPIMRETKGRADGGEVNRLLRSALGL